MSINPGKIQDPSRFIQGVDDYTPELDQQAIGGFLDLMLEVFAGTLQADRVSILLLNPVSQTLSIEAARGLPEGIAENVRLQPGEGIAGLALQERLPLRISRDQKPDYLNVPLVQQDVTASFVIPIYHEQHSLGAICASTQKEPGKFSRRNLDWMIEIANRLSPVLLALQHHKVRQQVIERMNALVETVDHLALMEEEDSAVELVLQVASRMCESSACFYAPVGIGADQFYLSNRRQIKDVQWKPVEIEYFEELGRRAIGQNEEQDVSVRHRAAYLVRESLAERRIDRVLILLIGTEGKLYGLLYVFPSRSSAGLCKPLRFLGSHLAAVLSRVDHLRQLESLAFIDKLTSAYNRNYWMERFREEMARAARMKEPLSIILFDVDDFKACNDRFGHRAGDEVLAQIAGTIRQSARNFDNVCRFGGEEFTVLLPRVSQHRAAMIAERIRVNVAAQAASQVSSVRGPDQVTVSGGVASFPEDSDQMEGLLEAADQGMYHAKRLGKNRVCFADGRPLR
jgi:diguanylate cyclase (GGDEF)-like protein